MGKTMLVAIVTAEITPHGGSGQELTIDPTNTRMNTRMVATVLIAIAPSQ